MRSKVRKSADQKFVDDANNEKLSMIERVQAIHQITALDAMVWLTRGSILIRQGRLLIGSEYPSWRNDI
jgi:hypothetical protein